MKQIKFQEQNIMDENDIDFRNYTEKQLQSILRFTKAVANSNKQLNDAVVKARVYAKTKNAEHIGKASCKRPEDVVIGNRHTS